MDDVPALVEEQDSNLIFEDDKNLMDEVVINDCADNIYDEAIYETGMKVCCISTKKHNTYEEFRRIASEPLYFTYHLQKY